MADELLVIAVRADVVFDHRILVGYVNRHLRTRNGSDEKKKDGIFHRGCIRIFYAIKSTHYPAHS
jgi:hypothetical protein